MAKTKETKTTKATKETKAVKAPSADLEDKLNRVANADQAVRAEDGANVLFISLCQSQAKALDEDDVKLHIPGLKVKDFYIQSKKLKLGNRLRVVPLAFLTVYNEFSGPGMDAKFVGIWHKEDALQHPLCIGHFFNRELPNGNELRPVKWVMLYLPDFPELDKTVITFKSTGNKIAKEWAKDIENNGGVSCQLIYELTAKGVSNDKGKWVEVQFENVGKVYEAHNGKTRLLEEFAEEVIDKSLELNESYRAGTLIPHRASAARQIEGRVTTDADDDDIAF